MDERHDSKLIEQLLSLVSMQDDESFSVDGISESAIHIKKFIDEIPGGFLIYQADGDEKIIFVNKELLRIFRCETFSEFKELTGNSFRGLVYSEDLEEVEASIKQQIEESQDDLDYVEYRILAKDGTIRWVEDYGHFLRSDSMGDIFYVFITDATEKITRREREHLQRLEVIEGLSVNYASILYASLDKNSVLAYRLSTRLIKQFDKILKERKFDEFVKEYVNMWVHPDDRAIIEEKLSPEYIRATLGANKTYYVNFRCIQNNETQYLQLRLVNVGQCNGEMQVVLGFRNIDEEVLQEMKQKKLLEEALNNAKLSYVAKNTFLSNMSHDMRTPLNAIFGYTALAKKNVKDSELTKSYLDKIETAGRSILNLVNRVLELSYMESQEFRIDEAQCNLHDVIQQVYRTALDEASAKDITISLHSSSLKHGDVYADKDKLKQILDRIVGNAVKYTRNGGHVDIDVTEESSASDDFSTFRFSVKDNGVGISEQFIKRIFEPFERENNTTLSGVYGSGLGLTIAKHLVDMMGGSIETNSVSGKGSVFTVSLNLRLQNTAQSATADTKKMLAYLKGKKILLVEDNEINLEIETEMLQDLGIKIVPAENGQIAVDKMSKAKPDEYVCVLMDIQMPVMDGRQAAAHIRKLPSAAANTPIIALSANAFENDKKLSLEAGMNDHITKPLEIAAFLKSLAKYIKKI